MRLPGNFRGGSVPSTSSPTDLDAGPVRSVDSHTLKLANLHKTKKIR